MESAGRDALVIQQGGTRLYLYHEPVDVGAGTRLCLPYSDLTLVKAALEALVVNRPDLTVDNDFGVVLPGDRFIARLQADPGWEWRRNPEVRGGRQAE